MRYEYWEESDTAYDTKITYGQYFRIIDKKDMVYLLNKQEERIKELEKKNEKLKEYNKSQELEIVRLHKLADAMSGVLRELGVYDVYDEKQINLVKKKLNESDNND